MCARARIGAGRVQKETVILSLLEDDGGRTEFEYDRSRAICFPSVLAAL